MPASAESSLHGLSELHTWYVDGASAHNFAGKVEPGQTSPGWVVPGQTSPPPLVTKLAHPRNGGPQYELSNHGIGPTTCAELTSIDLEDWPAVAGRPMYLAVEFNVLTNLTGCRLAIDAGDGAGWTYSQDLNHLTTYYTAPTNFAVASFQAIMPNATAIEHQGNGSIARFALEIWGENPTAGEAARVIVGAVAVGVVGAGWSTLVEQAAVDMTGLGGPGR